MMRFPNLEPGDIFTTRDKGIVGFINSTLMAPPTDEIHYGFILMGAKNDDGVVDDYVTLESIARKGIIPGRLSFYEDRELKFYRIDCPKELRERAPVELTRWGRSHYDYLLIPKIGTQGLWLISKHLITTGRFKPIRAEELTWSANNSLVCTEGVDVGCDAVGVNVIPPGVCPMPSAFRQAEIDGRIKAIGEEELYGK